MEALDGNAIAGLLQVAFGHEMTMAVGTCAECGTTSLLGALRVYMRAPGVVGRCPTCGAVELVLVESHGVVSVDLRGLAALTHPA